MTRLLYKIECKSTLPYFETIAAFDCYEAAACYAKRCAKLNPDYCYVVKNNNKILVRIRDQAES